jgi:hypothetical protein
VWGGNWGGNWAGDWSGQDGEPGGGFVVEAALNAAGASAAQLAPRAAVAAALVVDAASSSVLWPEMAGAPPAAPGEEIWSWVMANGRTARENVERILFLFEQMGINPWAIPGLALPTGGGAPAVQHGRRQQAKRIARNNDNLLALVSMIVTSGILEGPEP